MHFPISLLSIAQGIVLHIRGGTNKSEVWFSKAHNWLLKEFVEGEWPESEASSLLCCVCFVTALSRRHWCHPACGGGGPVSSQLLPSAAADPAAFLLHYPDVGIVDAFSLCPSVWFKGYFSVSEGKGLSPPSLSKYSLLSKYSVVWLWNRVQMHC